jgi:hypothetical protein
MTMSIPQPAPVDLASTARSGPLRPFLFTPIAATTAAVAAFASVSFDFPAWVMFVGWVGYATRSGTWRDHGADYACLVLGALLGIAAALTQPLLQPIAGAAALPIVVFVVASIVVSLRNSPPLNNLSCYFLGLIAFFAADQPPTATTWLQLAAAMGLGCVAASASAWLQARS